MRKLLFALLILLIAPPSFAGGGATMMMVGGTAAGATCSTVADNQSSTDGYVNVAGSADTQWFDITIIEFWENIRRS